MGREERSSAADTGRKGYREPDEPRDDRALIVRDVFWRSEAEQLTQSAQLSSRPVIPARER